MIPSSLSSSSSSSSSSAAVRVDKATSDLLIGPDWTMNIDICDSINTNQWDAKDVVKAVKKRLQHKNPKVQLLALTLLETMVKNCGDHVHFQIVERNILQEMVKIVKKKTDMHVRDKILALLDPWQEAFGGPGGKYPQYYWAYEELRRAGVVFPQRSLDSAPIFTPPVARSTLRHTQAGYGMPSNSSARLDEAMGAEMENLSLSVITSMRNVLDLLADMLQAVNPSDRASVKDEVIVDLVNRCRSNQKKLMQMLSTTGDEELLGQGLELNDSLQSVLAKHDAIASGSPLPSQVTDFKPRSVAAHDSSIKPTEVKEPSQTPNANPSAPAVTSVRAQIEEEEDQEDDFAQLARRHSKTHSITSQGTSTGHSGSVNVTSVNASINAVSPTQASVAPVPSNALALVDPPAPVRTTKEQDMIDLLSLTLSTVTASPQTPHTLAASSQNIHQPSVSLTSQGYPYASQAYTGNQGQVPFNSYVVPWAQPQSQLQPQPQSPSYLQPQPQLQPQSHSHPYFQPQPQPQAHLQSQPQSQTQPQSQLQPQYHSQPYFQPQPQAQLQHQPPSQSKLQPQSHSQPYFQPQPQAQLQHQPQSQSKLQTQSHSQPYFQAQTTPQDQLQPQHQSQTQPQPQPQPQAQLQHRLESQPQPQPQSHPQLQHQHESQPQPQPQHQPQYESQQRTQAQPQYLQYSSGYPPPPWAPTPGYLSNRNHLSTTSNMFSITRANAPASHTSMHGARPLHNVNSFTARGANVSLTNGEQRLSSSPRATAPAAGQKPFVPSYRLFEDLNVFGNGDGKFKMSSSTSPSLSGTSSPSMVGGRK